MLLIIEGQRNTGKTTSIKKFVEIAGQPTSPLFGVEVVSTKLPREKSQIVQIARTFLPMAFDDKLWITDRLHISEQVYTSLTGRKVEWLPSEMSWAEYFLSLGKVLVIQLTADVETLAERERVTGKASEGDISEIARLFKINMQRTVLTTATINVERKSPDDVAKEIESIVFSQILMWKGEQR